MWATSRIYGIWSKHVDVISFCGESIEIQRPTAHSHSADVAAAGLGQAPLPHKEPIAFVRSSSPGPP